MGGTQRSLRFEMPAGAPEPVLVEPGLGIARASRRGQKHTFTRTTTLLDTPDHRLLRSGIVLAHRVVDGLGEWYLDAPGWAPWLPSGRTQPLGAAGDLPQEFASLVRPFRRRAALGPVAAITCERTGWLLLDAQGRRLARLRDERVTIRRAGVTTSCVREVTLRPGALLTPAQRNHLVEALLAAGATRVERFVPLVERLGAPATGLSDFRGPFARDDDQTLEGFVSWLFARRLDAVLRADLELRSGHSDDMGLLRRELAGFRREVRSLSFALEPQWRELLEQELELVLRGLASRTVHQLGDEYFDVLDSLVTGVRAPKLGDLSGHRAVEALRQQARAGATILFDRAGSLTLGSPDERWAATLASAQQMDAIAHTCRLVLGKRVRRIEAVLAEVVEALRLAQMPPGVAQVRVDLDWDAATAFQEGRRFERRRQECAAARLAFVEQWPALEQRLRTSRGRDWLTGQKAGKERRR